MRVLDLDLDFFVCGTAHYVDSAEERLDPDAYPPWPVPAAITFLIEAANSTGGGQGSSWSITASSSTAGAKQSLQGP